MLAFLRKNVRKLRTKELELTRPLASDIPGPGSYKIPEESRLEAYKKGAFLEKADRFEAEKGSDVPGESTQTTAYPSHASDSRI